MDFSKLIVTTDTRAKVEAVILHLGIDPSLKGYYYVTEIISLYLSGVGLNTNLCDVYKYVAQRFNTTWSRLERCVRHAILKAFNYLVSQEIDFGFTEDGYLPNKQFIFTVVRHIVRCDQMGKPYFKEKR